MNNKWIAISLGSLIGLSHIGMIGMISRQQKFPVAVSYTHLTQPTKA